MVLSEGKILRLKRPVAGKPEVVKILDKDPESEHLIHFTGGGKEFYRNRVYLERIYTDKGVQQELFPTPKTILQRKHLKS